MRVPILLLSVIIFSAGGCVSNTSFEPDSPMNGEIIRDQNLVSQISSAPASVIIDDVEYLVESYAYRDFMPSVDPPVRLILNNTLIRTDGDSVPSNIEIIQQYVVKDNEIWRPDEWETRLNQSNPNQLYIISREGPTWEIGSKVNIGLKIKNQNTGDSYWFSIPEVEIVQTS